MALWFPISFGLFVLLGGDATYCTADYIKKFFGLFLGAHADYGMCGTALILFTVRDWPILGTRHPTSLENGPGRLGNWLGGAPHHAHHGRRQRSDMLLCPLLLHLSLTVGNWQLSVLLIQLGGCCSIIRPG